jgi:hypothetical protein
MRTPFEDLEYLAEYLPEEGEAVIVARRDGELVCEPFRQERSENQTRDGLLDVAFYGRLVQANERLNAISSLPLWVASLLTLVLCVTVHKQLNVGWTGWYYDLGIGLLILGSVLAWIQSQQGRLFRREIRTMLEAQLRQRGIPRHALIGVIRQHPELRSLLNELTHWTD